MSTTDPVGSVTADVLLTSAIVPVEPLGFRLPVASAAGSAAPFEPLLPPSTRKYPWAGMDPVSGTTPFELALVVPDRYCTEVPSSEIAVSVGL